MRGWGVASAALVAVALIVAPSVASPSLRPCTHGYTYAGLASRDGTRGVAASVRASGRPAVYTGHAAAWVGVGGIHAGPGGVNEWIQAGIAAFPHEGLRLYVEEVSRGEPRRFVDLGRAVPGRSYRVRVVETGGDVWRAFVEGRAVGRPTYLPTRRGAWRAVATAESWAGGRAECNRYAYRFDGLAVRRGARWSTLALARAQRVGAPVNRRASGFSARY
jgi:hypothetical protein